MLYAKTLLSLKTELAEYFHASDGICGSATTIGLRGLAAPHARHYVRRRPRTTRVF